MLTAHLNNAVFVIETDDPSIIDVFMDGLETEIEESVRNSDYAHSKQCIEYLLN